MTPVRFRWTSSIFGAGVKNAKNGFYQIAENWDGRYGIPGTEEVADLTGIAATFRVIKMLKHADTDIVIATDGTTTRVYRKETTWVSKVDQLDGGASSEDAIVGVATDAVSFKNVLAIALGGSAAYVYTTATTATGRTWGFVTSTKTAAGNPDRANKFLVQVNGVLEPRVTYGVSPNEIYYTTDLTNTDGIGVLPTYIGDSASTMNAINSIAEDNAGRVVIGMRRGLWTVDEEGVLERLTEEEFDDPRLDATGQSDRDNFELCVKLGGKLWYNVEGYDWGWWDGQQRKFNRYCAPRHGNPLLKPEDRMVMPRADLPINAATKAGGWLILFLGSKSTATIKDVTLYPGGGSHLASTFTTASEMWVGLPYGEGVIWHGVQLLCTNPLRYAWWDEDDSYLYMASGDSESANLQMTRCLFFTDHPLHRLTSSAVVLTEATEKIEFGALDFGEPWEYKHPKAITLDTLGLAATAPAWEVEYQVAPDYESTAFESDFVTFDDNHDAEVGAEFDTGEPNRAMHLRLVGTAGTNLYPILKGFEVVAEMDSTRHKQLPRHR